MAELAISRRLMMRTAFIGLSLLIIFFHLLPLNTRPTSWAPPDFLLAFAFAWVLRRPDYVPPISIAAVILLADLLFLRPPGLMALLAVLGCESLKTRTATLGEASFAGEWLAVSLTLTAITVANRLTLALLGVEQAQLSLSLIQLILTLIVYPLVVLISQSVIGVRKPAPGDADALAVRT